MKAVFVDGGSLNWMREPLGIGKYDYKKLREVLANQIGTPNSIIGPPAYTVSSEMQASMGKVLKYAGFDTIEFAIRYEEDGMIIDRIRRLGPGVSEIVIVSADLDFAEVLEPKKAEGVAIHYVATRRKTRDGSPMVGASLEKFFENGTFIFHDLYDYKDFIMLEPWENKRSWRPSSEREKAVDGGSEAQADSVESAEDSRKVKVALELEGTHEETMTLFQELGKLMRRFPRTRYKLNIEG